MDCASGLLANRTNVMNGLWGKPRLSVGIEFHSPSARASTKSRYSSPVSVESFKNSLSRSSSNPSSPTKPSRTIHWFALRIPALLRVYRWTEVVPENIDGCRLTPIARRILNADEQPVSAKKRNRHIRYTWCEDMFVGQFFAVAQKATLACFALIIGFARCSTVPAAAARICTCPASAHSPSILQSLSTRKNVMWTSVISDEKAPRSKATMSIVASGVPSALRPPSTRLQTLSFRSSSPLSLRPDVYPVANPSLGSWVASTISGTVLRCVANRRMGPNCSRPYP